MVSVDVQTLARSVSEGYLAPTGAEVISHGRKPVELEQRIDDEALKGRKKILFGMDADVSPFQGFV